MDQIFSFFSLITVSQDYFEIIYEIPTTQSSFLFTIYKVPSLSPCVPVMYNIIFNEKLLLNLVIAQI